MPLVNMKDMLDHAYRHNYAVGAFAVVNLEFLQGVIAAAERCRAPVILSLEQPRFEPVDFGLLVAAGEYAAQRCSVPVAIHMHHGRDLACAVSAVNGGCNGVMVDASHRSLGDNIDVTREVVAMARGCGVPVEGKLGHVPAAPGGAAPPDSEPVGYTAVAEARGYVERTGVDFLAVSVGTVRGRTKARPKINWQRLKQLNEALGMPLTVYGGTGLTDSHYGRLIANGVAKIDYYTALAEAAFDQVRSTTKGAKGRYSSAMHAVQEAVERQTETCLRLCGAAGRAAEVWQQCAHWAAVEQVVTHDVHGIDERGIEAVVDEGRRILSTIPGVREVSGGEAVREDEIFRCRWLVRFCNPAAIDSHREHPDYLTFLGRRSRPEQPAGAPTRRNAWGGPRTAETPPRLVSQGSRG